MLADGDHFGQWKSRPDGRAEHGVLPIESLDGLRLLTGGSRGDIHGTRVSRLVTGLVDKSMVNVRSGPGPTRYGVLETLRAYS